MMNGDNNLCHDLLVFSCFSRLVYPFFFYLITVTLSRLFFSRKSEELTMWVLSVRNVIALLFLTLVFTTAVITLSQKSSIARKASEEVILGVKAAVKTIPLSTNRSMAEYTNRPSKHKTENLMLQRLYQTHELLNQIYKTTEFTTQPNLRGRLLSSQRNIPQELQPAPLSTTFTEKCSLIIPKDKKVFYSQSQEDLGLFLKLFHKPLRCGGTMLEMGALDGVLYSNSKFFEDALGWRTILLEANPNNAKRMFLTIRGWATSQSDMVSCT